MRRIVSTLALAALVTGCGGASETGVAEDQASQEPAIERDARYGTVEALKDAAVEAGYTCDRWKQKGAVTLAAESGNCSDADVLATFATESDLQAQVDAYRDFNELFTEAGMDPSLTLIGPNWSIHGATRDDLEMVQEKLGGTILE